MAVLTTSKAYYAGLCFSAFSSVAAAAFSPCPVLGSWEPAPRINRSSSEIQSLAAGFTELLTNYTTVGNGDFGTITPNTTSFSIALFGGSNDPDAEDEDAAPYFYSFHHTASMRAATGNASAALSEDSVFAVGALTQLFTVFTSLLEIGDGLWERSIVEFVPELVEPRRLSAEDDIGSVRWKEVTLGALAGHMAGIARDSDACQVDQACSKSRFLRAMMSKQPVFLPDTTPVYSNAAFQFLSYAIEQNCGRPFAELLTERVLDKLQMDQTSLLGPNTMLFGPGLGNDSLSGEPAALGLTSTLNDLSTFGRSMLTSGLLTPAQTRGFLKPIASTSNLRNAVGRPWEIYHFGDEATDPIHDIYTKTGSIGRYSSYFGLAPDHDVGFVILAVDEVTQAPDLNAYADVTLAALTELDQLGRLQAKANLAGTYKAAGNSTLVMRQTGTNDPGLAVTSLHVNGTDWLANIAATAGIKSSDLDFRLYPTNVEQAFLDGGKKQAFRAVIQDKSAPVDAGTPTCISWMTMDEQERFGLPLDEMVFELDGAGKGSAIMYPALSTRFQRQ